MKVVVTGASGFVGRRLVEVLADSTDWDIAVTSRRPETCRGLFPNGVAVLAWDPAAGPPPEKIFSDAGSVVNLAGENVASGRWNVILKQKIRDSRVLTTRHLVQGMAAAKVRPQVLINASAIGFYGPRGGEEITEAAAPGEDFLAQVCMDWEKEAQQAEALGVRVTLLRVGVVLGADGGALKKMLLPFKLGAGGPLGSGRQWMSWIHLDDLCGLILHAIQKDQVSGPLNGTAPAPVTNRDFARALGKTLHRPAFLPTPGFALRLAVGEFADILLTGQKVIPKKALDTGYNFQYPELEKALSAIFTGK